MQQAAGGRFARVVPANWPLLAAFTVMAIPTFVRLGQQVWPLDIGAHGPIVLATGSWLLARAVASMRQATRPPSWALIGVSATIAGLVYAFGRAFDYISIEALGLYAMMCVMAYRQFGFAALKRNFFPFFYLAFLIPPPGFMLDMVTQPLQELVSTLSSGLMALLGYPIARQGVVILIGPYELLVEQACAGMNSLVGLVAVSLFYIYLRYHASWRYAVLFAVLVVPVAILTNLLRVIVLIALTYHAGDGVAQGFLHVTSGALLFLVALAMMFALDWLLHRLLPASMTGAEP